ncbi:MAG TPA: hypothetical protein VH309_06025 [Elusimicrobiota bacterium]|jgi:hypothetical protein|nr:hypothetical protein [Elusimicrobiota bacterium]
MRVIAGAFIAGIVLYLVPGRHSGPACLVAGALLTFLLLQLGPRSFVERLGAVMTISLIAWVAGPRAALHESLLWHLLGWAAAGSALAFYLRPKSE